MTGEQALSPIFLAKRKKIPIHIWVDETRPRNQGALLTSWELKNENIPHTVIVDNAGGYLMQNKRVDMCLVGSDRTTISGNVCNKIGTYLKAVVAYENKIPFFVALPTSTIDKKTKKISEIPIEIRDGNELSKINFKIKNKLLNANIYQKQTPTLNPAFDVTPRKFITKLITEKGVCKPEEKLIKNLLKKVMTNISKQIIETYRRHLEIGLNIGSEGNISIRKNKLIYITPSGINIENLKEENISVIDIKGKKNKIKPSSELDLHLMLYQNREDIGSIVHCHSDWASTLSCLRKNIPSISLHDSRIWRQGY